MAFFDVIIHLAVAVIVSFVMNRCFDLAQNALDCMVFGGFLIALEWAQLRAWR